MTKIKICGLRRMEDIEYVNIALPDYIGFIIDFPKSHRNVSSKNVMQLKSELDKGIEAVGVFVNSPIDTIKQLCDEGAIDMIQLHGIEDNDFINKLKAVTDKEIIKAFIIDENFDIKTAEECACDYVLFDGGMGNGKNFPHEIIKNVARPFFLAGGLSNDNLKEIITKVNPYCVDISTGVETDKKKDFEKICKAVKTAKEEV